VNPATAIVDSILIFILLVLSGSFDCGLLEFCISSQSAGGGLVVFGPFTAVSIFSPFQNPVNPPVVLFTWLN
jgi:hypothetical protein